MSKESAAEIGRIGEVEAERFLKKKGYRILFRNWRSPRWGEIDLIAVDKGTLVFVEVKTRSSDSRGQPYDAVNFYKLRTLKRAAFYFKRENPQTPGPMRIDVVSVNLDGKMKIEHFQSIYDDSPS